MNEGKLIHLSTGTASNRGAASKHPSIAFAANPVIMLGMGSDGQAVGVLTHVWLTSRART